VKNEIGNVLFLFNLQPEAKAPEKGIAVVAKATPLIKLRRV